VGCVIVRSSGVERKIESVNQVIVAVGVTSRQDLKAMLKEKNIRRF
jgi:hypothetical protein